MTPPSPLPERLARAMADAVAAINDLENFSSARSPLAGAESQRPSPGSTA